MFCQTMSFLQYFLKQSQLQAQFLNESLVRNKLSVLLDSMSFCPCLLSGSCIHFRQYLLVPCPSNPFFISSFVFLCFFIPFLSLIPFFPLALKSDQHTEKFRSVQQDKKGNSRIQVMQICADKHFQRSPISTQNTAKQWKGNGKQLSL